MPELRSWAGTDEFRGVSGSYPLAPERSEPSRVSQWQHQADEIDNALAPSRALFWSPRTGKTRTIVKQIEKQIEAGARRVLIVAPQLVCQTVWTVELAESGLLHHDLSSGKLPDRKARIKLLTKSEYAYEIVLVNWDTLARLVDDLLKFAPDVVIADEAHLAKSAGSARSRALHRLGKVAKYRRILTGTPTPKNYVDLYSQYKFLAPSIFGTRKDKFLERYVEADEYGRVKFYRNLPELRKKMTSVASVFDRRIAWKDAPPQVVRRSFKLPVQARALYDKLATDTIAEFEGIEIDGTHKLARTIKFLQLVAGFVHDEDGNVKWVHTALIDGVIEELRDLLDAGEKVVIFYHFAEEGKRIEEAIRNEFGAVVGRIGGDTKIGTREGLAKSFLSPTGIRVMVMQDSLGIGISLKSASYVIRTSYPLDYAAYVQSNDRVYEPGKPLTYIELEASRTVAQWARRVCTTKDAAQRTLLANEALENILGAGKLNLGNAA